MQKGTGGSWGVAFNKQAAQNSSLQAVILNSGLLTLTLRTDAFEYHFFGSDTVRLIGLLLLLLSNILQTKKNCPNLFFFIIVFFC